MVIKSQRPRSTDTVNCIEASHTRDQQFTYSYCERRRGVRGFLEPDVIMWDSYAFVVLGYKPIPERIWTLEGFEKNTESGKLTNPRFGNYERIAGYTKMTSAPFFIYPPSRGGTIPQHFLRSEARTLVAGRLRTSLADSALEFFLSSSFERAAYVTSNFTFVNHILLLERNRSYNKYLYQAHTLLLFGSNVI